jgi:hypothetical protein
MRRRYGKNDVRGFKRRGRLKSLHQKAEMLDLAIIHNNDVYGYRQYKIVNVGDNSDIYPLRWYSYLDEVGAALSRIETERKEQK